MKVTLSAPTPPRSPWQLFYNGIHRVRRRWHRGREAGLPRPVVSIGNLHWGGTGKTPLVAAVARHLHESGRRVAILSRGYGRRGNGVRVVSIGEGPLLGPRLGGDEPVTLAGELPGVAVVVGEDRYEAGRHAMERLPDPPDCFVLDDGFSHLRLARDLDILVFPAQDPFGGGRLAPSGRLREPLASAAHASAAILSGAESPSGASGTHHSDGDGGTRDLGAELAASLAPFGFRGPGFASSVRALDVVTERGAKLSAGSRVLLTTGIARPNRFRRTVEKRALEFAGHLEFGDHHAYSDRDVRRIDSAARETGAPWVLTTAKDHVKLLGRLETPLAYLPIRAEPEARFWNWLEEALAAIP